MEHLTKTKLILCCALALVFSVGVWAATLHEQAGTTITVDTTSDVISDDGFCSLREAIVAANSDSPYQDCPGGSGADIVVFSPGLPQPATITLAIGGTGEDGALTGDLDIIGNLTISATYPITVDGNGLDRIFQVLPGARVTISGLTIHKGDPGAGVDGGGVAVDLTAVLTLTHSSVISNTAQRGGGIQVLGRLNLSDVEIDANQGGGINSDGGLSTLNDVHIRRNGGLGVRNDNVATLTFNGGTVSHNQGGGVYNNVSNVTLSNVAVISNTGSGGVFSAGSGTIAARLTVNACTILSNTATNGAGIFSQGINARANIYNTNISGNTATSDGGGVFNNGLMTLTGSTIRLNQARSGGGIGHFGGNLYMTNDTVSGNTAGDNGGGLYNRSSAILTNVTLANNVTGEPETGPNIFVDTSLLSIRNSILAYADADGNCFISEGFLTSLGHNLDSGDTCGFNAAGDIINTDPLLGPLQDNGGPTPTHALNPGSPAIDAGDDAECPATDQRGVARPQGSACDIGAYEYLPDADADLSIVKAVNPDPVDAGAPLAYTLTISNAGPDPATLVSLVDTLPQGVTFGSAVGRGWNCNQAANVITCTRDDLGIGAAPVVTITVTAPLSGGTITNTATVSSLAQDPDSANNTARVGSIVNPPAPAQADLSIAKQASPDPVLAGTTLTYTLSVENLGPNTALSITVTDHLPPEVTFLNVVGSGWSCSHADGSVACTRPGLTLATAPAINIAVLAPQSSGTITNTVSVGSATADPNTSNNSASAQSIVKPVYRVYVPLVLCPEPVLR